MEQYKEKQYICDVFKKLIEIKNKDVKINKNSSSKWKIKSLESTLNILSSLENSYIEIDEIKDIKGIGKGGITRIEEIMDSGYLKEIQDYEKNIDSTQEEATIQIEKLESISGIGNVKANKLFKDNITFDILMKERLEYDITNFKENEYLKNLTKHQFICLKYYEDISSRIPRKEIEEFDEILSNVFSEIDKNLVYEICGSYRRKNTDSGDIDILFCDKNCQNYEDLDNSPKYLKLLLKKLKKMNIIVENLTNSGDLKYMGICKIPGHNLNRRLDIKYVPYCSYIPGLLHFTGSYKENIRLRQIGKEKNFKINEYGIYIIKEDSEELIILNTEKELYDILDENYKSPEERN
jgi:DNA polymerase/3'-5' exonuclease PolX